MSRPRLAVTAGDPAGIGPEIVAKSLASGALGDLGDVVVYAEPSLFDRACRDAGTDPLPRVEAGAEVRAGIVSVRPEPVPGDFAPGTPSRFTGRVAADCVTAAARDALAGRVDAVVTAPLAKSALRAAGVRHPGHTELLGEIAGADPVVMMFVARELRVSLATVHLPLRDVPATLTTEGLLATIRLTRDALIRFAGIPAPDIAVLGLNPHAGEGGLFGDEEARIVEPAIVEARGLGWRVEGPFPADAFFLRRAGRHDVVVAMYHDQGLIPVKLASHGLAVNVTLGLPFLRTSVDHGTAFDIAGQGCASEGSLLEAARLAADWTARAGA